MFVYVPVDTLESHEIPVTLYVKINSFPVVVSVKQRKTWISIIWCHDRNRR